MPLLPGLPLAGLVAAAEHVVVDRTRQYLLVEPACGMWLTPPCTSPPNLQRICKLLTSALDQNVMGRMPTSQLQKLHRVAHPAFEQVVLLAG